MATASPPIAPPAVYTGAGAGGASLYSFNANTGTERWCNRFINTVKSICTVAGHGCTPPGVASTGKPLLAANVLYVCVSGETFAFYASNGVLRWQRNTNCDYQSNPFEDDAQPILAGGLLYTNSYALNAADGTIRWRLSLPNGAVFVAVADGIAYAVYDDVLYAFAASTGVQRWHYQFDDSISAIPSVANGIIYASDYLLLLHALDAKTGVVLWENGVSTITNLTADAAKGLVYVGGAVGKLYALDASTGALRWQCPIGTSRANAPLDVNGVIYLSSDGMYAINATDGSVRWHALVDPSSSFTSVALFNDLLYVGGAGSTGGSVLYALSINNGDVLWHTGDINPSASPAAG